MKSAPVWKMIVVVIFVIAVATSLLILDHIPARRLMTLMGFTAGVTDAPKTPEVSPTTLIQPLSTQASALSPGTVAVQTFSGHTLVRSGSGAVVSSDGLIITTTSVAPYGSGSYAYQVITTDGTVLRVVSTWRNGSGLVILKVSATSLSAVSFDEYSPLIAGERMVDTNGRSVGLVQFGGSYPRMISSAVLNAAVNQYLSLSHSK